MPDKNKKPILSEFFRKLLPPLTDYEQKMLRHKVLQDGKCLEDLTVWEETNILVDGYHRFDIMVRNKIKPKYRYQSFRDYKEAAKWAINNQLSRRNLPDNLLDYYQGKEYMEMVEAEIAKGLEGPSKSKTEIQEQLSEKHGVSGRTISDNAIFARAVDALPDDEKAKVLAGEGTKVETIAKAKLLCDKCQNGRPWRDCPKCATLRAGSAVKATNRKSMRHAKADWQKAEDAITAVKGLQLWVEANYPQERDSSEGFDIQKLCDELMTIVNKWKKRLASKVMPD